MKLGTIGLNGKPTPIARLDDRQAVTLADAYAAAKLGAAPASLLALIEAGPEELARLKRALAADLSKAPKIDLRDADWMAPVTRPSKILGVAFNNRKLTDIAHIRPTKPMFFLKPPSALTGHNKPIMIGSDYGRTIPELELGVILGKRFKNATEQQARAAIFGYTIVNDVTCTGLKFTLDSIAIDLAPDQVEPVHLNWRRRRDENDHELYFTYHTRSKGADTFGPMGPWLTTADEVANPNDLKVMAWYNDEPLTEDSTANYQFKVEEVIAEASRFFTLEPGDIFHCGTTGKGIGRFKRGHLSLDLSKNKGTVSATIGDLGRLSNPIEYF